MSQNLQHEVDWLMKKAVESAQLVACDGCDWRSCDRSQANPYKEALRELQRSWHTKGYVPKTWQQCALKLSASVIGTGYKTWQEVILCKQKQRITHERAASSATTKDNHQSFASGVL